VTLSAELHTFTRPAPAAAVGDQRSRLLQNIFILLIERLSHFPTSIIIYALVFESVFLQAAASPLFCARETFSFSKGQETFRMLKRRTSNLLCTSKVNYIKYYIHPNLISFN
jgi:hypothetical protein